MSFKKFFSSIKVCILILFLASKSLFSQDILFTQFFNFPEQISPSFTSMSKNTKVGIIDRTQWFGLENAINSQYLFFDTYVDNINSGIGISILNQLESVTRFNDKKIKFNYSYHLKINENWNLRPGIYASFGLRDFSFQNLIFEDQIKIFQGKINSISLENNLTNESANYLDFGASFLIFNPNIWAGVNFNHINKPNLSFIYNGISTIDFSYSIHAGSRLSLNNYNYRKQDYNVYFNFNYLYQNEMNRLDLGTVFEFNKIGLGGFYSTSIFDINNINQSIVSTNFLINYTYKKMKIGLSYDVNLSDLKNTNGVFEVSITSSFRNILSSNLPCYCK